MQFAPICLAGAAGTGFCGGFTAYSTCNYETMKMLQERAFAVAALNAAATGIGCLVPGAGRARGSSWGSEVLPCWESD